MKDVDLERLRLMDWVLKTQSAQFKNGMRSGVSKATRSSGRSAAVACMRET